MSRSSAPVVLKRRCAIYTRTSSDERLSQEFSSLDAQREACAAYILSQKAEGWVPVDDRYDDGGHSGGTMDRPALKRLLEDIAAGRVDVVVTYKIDRLSRSMRDFMNLIDLFDANQVTCVSITQNFSTTTSMGRLTLNMLLSFAQFERELGRERTRDKIAASRAKGIWMGGSVSLGYRAENRKLVIDETEAAIVRQIFSRFAEGWPVKRIVDDLAIRGIRTGPGRPITKAIVSRLLRNKIYLGLAVHKEHIYEGEHDAIIGQSLWDRAQGKIRVAPKRRGNEARASTPALLKGLIFTSAGHAMSPSHTRRKGRLYRYYISQAVLKHGAEHCEIGRVAAGDIEALVMQRVRSIVLMPEVIAATASHLVDSGITEDGVRQALQAFDPLWETLFPAEQARIVQLLVARVEVSLDAVDITLRLNGLFSFTSTLNPMRQAA